MVKAKAIRVHELGGPEVMRWEEVELGDPKEGEIRIRTTAIGVNFIDVYFRKGVYAAPALPFTPGRFPNQFNSSLLKKNPLGKIQFNSSTNNILQAWKLLALSLQLALVSLAEKLGMLLLTLATPWDPMPRSRSFQPASLFPCRLQLITSKQLRSCSRA